MTLAWFAYALMGAGIVVWTLTAGADLGGGLWDLVVRGPDRARDRAAIARAIAPIWEANHVWLIFVIVVLFGGFPRAFAVVGIALHVPIAIGLVGIVVRGSAFTFRAYGLGDDDERRRFGLVFGASSLVTPIAFGMALAGTASSRIRVVGDRVIDAPPLATWLSPFGLATGLFALALFALVAAAHLAADAGDDDVRRRFARRAIVSEAIAFVCAACVLALSASAAPDLFAALSRAPFAIPLHVATAASALSATGAFLVGRASLGRALVVLQVSCVVVGYGASMNGALVLRDVTLANSAAPDRALAPMLVVIVVGTLLLVPSLAWLYRIARPASVDDAHT